MRLTRARSFSLAFVLPATLSLTLGQEPRRIPDCALEVAVKVREDGTVGRAVHNFELRCARNACQLVTLSLNQCGERADGSRAFYPKVNISTTADGSLTVRREGANLIATEKDSGMGGEYTVTLRFGFEAPKSPRTIASKVTSFSGAYVKDSQILGRVLTAEYVPLRASGEVIGLDCGVLLRGVDSN